MHGGVSVTSEKDILVRNRLKNLEIDAQKRVIFEIKSPFNLRLEPEFSFSDPVGDPGGTRLFAKAKRLRRASPRRIQNKFWILARLLRRPNPSGSHPTAGCQNLKRIPEGFVLNSGSRGGIRTRDCMDENHVS